MIFLILSYNPQQVILKKIKILTLTSKNKTICIQQMQNYYEFTNIKNKDLHN